MAAAPTTILCRAIAPVGPAEISKNRMWRRSRRGGYYMPEAYTMIRDALEAALRSDLVARDVEPPRKAKIWIVITVYRADFRSDPINALDFVCDAAKLAIKVDDRWFSATVDWEVDRQEPRIEVSVET